MTPPADQPPHWHTHACWRTTVVCGRLAHQHDDSCWDSTGTRLTCRLTEHAHSTACNRTETTCGYP